MSEQVNHPAHYQKNGRECIDVMIEKFGVQAVISFCECNEFKYLWRAGLKDGNSEDQDRRKAEWYRKKAEELKNELVRDIEPTADSLAKDLTKSLMESNEATLSFFESLSNTLEMLRQEIEMAVCEKTCNIYSRYINAPFITRWYWKRKLDKSKIAFEETRKALETITKKHADH